MRCTVHMGTHFLLPTRSKKFSPKNKKDLGIILHPLKSEETRGNAITQPWSHSIKKMGWDGTVTNQHCSTTNSVGFTREHD